jgi:hypothetical protein
VVQSRSEVAETPTIATQPAQPGGRAPVALAWLGGALLALAALDVVLVLLQFVGRAPSMRRRGEPEPAAVSVQSVSEDPFGRLVLVGHAQPRKFVGIRVGERTLTRSWADEVGRFTISFEKPSYGSSLFVFADGTAADGLSLPIPASPSRAPAVGLAIFVKDRGLLWVAGRAPDIEGMVRIKAVTGNGLQQRAEGLELTARAARGIFEGAILLPADLLPAAPTHVVVNRDARGEWPATTSEVAAIDSSELILERKTHLALSADGGEVDIRVSMPSKHPLVEAVRQRYLRPDDLLLPAGHFHWVDGYFRGHQQWCRRRNPSHGEIKGARLSPWWVAWAELLPAADRPRHVPRGVPGRAARVVRRRIARRADGHLRDLARPSRG